MKYYILTSSINIDNILSSESISPATFYPRRGFGYATFESIKQLPKDYITLFKYIPYVEIYDEERENHPIVIEIDEICVSGELQGDNISDVVFINKTIQLTPWNCRILYFSMLGYILCKQKCDDSLCNKLFNRYAYDIFRKEDAKKITEIKIPQISVDNSAAIKKDIYNNARKGLLYGFALGTMKTVSPNTAFLRSMYKTARDYVAAAIQNNKSNSHYLNKIEEIDNEIQQKDKNREELLNLYYSEVDKKTRNRLHNYELELSFIKKFAQENNFNVRLITEITSDNLSAYEESLRIYVDKQVCKDADNLMVNDNEVSKLANIDENTITCKFIKDFVLSGKLSFNDIRRKNENLLCVFKEFLEINNFTDTTEEYKYFKSLASNIFNATEFYFNSLNNKELQSIAAILLYGDSYEKLVDFLERNAFNEFKYALGIWGAMKGYVDIPKSTILPVLNSDNFKQFYFTIFKTIYEKELCENNYQDIRSSDLKNTYTPEILKPFFESKEFISLTEETQKFAKSKVIELFNENKQIIDNAFIDALNIIDFPKQGIKSLFTKKEWKKCLKYFEPKKITQNKQSSPLAELPLYQFFEDIRSFEYIKQLLPDDDKLVKQWEADLKYFQDNYKPTYKDKNGNINEGKYKDCLKDNKSVIDNYKAFCEDRRDRKIDKNGKSLDWVYENYVNINIESIIKELNERYICV